MQTCSYQQGSWAESCSPVRINLLLLPSQQLQDAPCTRCLLIWGWKLGLKAKGGRGTGGVWVPSPAEALAYHSPLCSAQGAPGHRVETIPLGSYPPLLSPLNHAFFGPYLVVIWLWAAVHGKPGEETQPTALREGQPSCSPSLSPSRQGPQGACWDACRMPGKAVRISFSISSPGEKLPNDFVITEGFCCFGRTPLP